MNVKNETLVHLVVLVYPDSYRDFVCLVGNASRRYCDNSIISAIAGARSPAIVLA